MPDEHDIKVAEKLGSLESTTKYLAGEMAKLNLDMEKNHARLRDEMREGFKQISDAMTLSTGEREATEQDLSSRLGKLERWRARVVGATKTVAWIGSLVSFLATVIVAAVRFFGSARTVIVILGGSLLILSIVLVAG